MITGDRNAYQCCGLTGTAESSSFVRAGLTALCVLHEPGGVHHHHLAPFV